MFYWMLLNIHPAHRSTLHSIQLLAVAKSTDIRVYGIDAVLTPLIKDLKILAEDVCMSNLCKPRKGEWIPTMYSDIVFS